MTSFTPNEQIDKSKIWPTGLAAIGLSLVANLLAYFILNAVLDLPSPAEFPPLSPAAIGIMTALFTFLAVVAFVVVVRVAKRPLRTYRIAATVVFFLSIIPNIISAVNPAAAPFPFPVASASGFLVLIIFHVIAYLIMVWLLTTKIGKT